MKPLFLLICVFTLIINCNGQSLSIASINQPSTTDSTKTATDKSDLICEIDQLIDNFIANADELQAQATQKLLAQAAGNAQARSAVITALKWLVFHPNYQSRENAYRWRTRQRAILLLLILQAEGFRYDDQPLAHKIVVRVKKSHYNRFADLTY